MSPCEQHACFLHVVDSAREGGCHHIDHMASTRPQESYLILKDGDRAAQGPSGHLQL